MSALSSASGEWQTPPWLAEKCRAALGGYITLDAATSEANNMGAEQYFTAADDALTFQWACSVAPVERPPTLFLNPPGEKSGKLIRAFWRLWDRESRLFHAAVWVDFNLDHLRFLKRVQGDCLVIPRKRMAFVDPLTGLERKGAQIGGFIYFRGAYGLTKENSVTALFPEPSFLVMWGEP
jgi:phage N-6-adenine-methyltransferase